MQLNQEQIGSDGGQVNLACFVLRNRLFALDVSHVREIVRFEPITPLPKAPSLIEGVVELRDGVVPIIDLGNVLGDEPVDTSTSSARIAVLEFDGLILGLTVEAATDVLSLDATALEDPPALATHAGYDAVRAVVRQKDSAPVMVLSLEHILESVYRSALSERGE
jgi:purine-binding chemotaxis protein CheW